MREVVLGNSLTLAMVPCEAESVAAGVFVASGSRHEPAKVAGISHFIEHMLFKGTAKRRAIDITKAIEGRGGMFNACTGEESTCYFVHMPDEYLAEAIDILADMYLHAAMRKDDFELEKQVILEEIKMYADDPSSVAAENMQRALFPDNPLGAPVAGSPESLLPMTPRDLKDYMKRHYLSSNTIVAITGKFDEKEAERIVRKAFGRKLAARREEAFR
ncbi:MAG: insulinase family protein, partial [Kiritimatiellae bacterium]|nr:insulinase family protein [Kiritimatiellia bacterium]